MLNLILKDREERWKKRCELADRFKASVITVNMNIPGPNKTKDKYCNSHEIFMEEIIEVIKDRGYFILYSQTRLTHDGPEGFLVIEEDPLKLKSLTVDIEESHLLGRLVDVDIMDKEGKTYSRRDLNLPQRKCILCSKSARDCIIERNHSLDELLDVINSTIDTYL